MAMALLRSLFSAEPLILWDFLTVPHTASFPLHTGYLSRNSACTLDRCADYPQWAFSGLWLRPFWETLLLLATLRCERPASREAYWLRDRLFGCSGIAAMTADSVIDYYKYYSQ